jgi:erythromycin esterase
MSRYVRQVAAGIMEGGDTRDRGMAENLARILDELYPDSRVVVWAHNSHIRHAGPQAVPASMPQRPGLHAMGTWLAEWRRDELYTIGLYMYRGASALNTGLVAQVRPAEAGSLESILHRSGLRYAFVDLLHQRREPGTEWMFRPITARHWGITDERLVPREQYDAILFIDTVTPRGSF